MKPLVVFFVLYCNTFSAQAEVVARPMHEILFGCDLIVSVKITNHTDSNFTLRVDDILRDYQIGIKTGDYIKIKKDMQVETSSERIDRETIVSKQSGIAFLTFHAGRWYLTRFSKISPSDTVTLGFGICQIQGSLTQVKAQVQAYFKEFKLNENKQLVGKLSAKEVEEKELEPLVLLQYYQLFPMELSSTVVRKLDCLEIVEPE